MHFEGRIDFAIPSFVEHITLTKDSSGAPFWIGQCWFTMATLIGMSWPYRVVQLNFTPGKFNVLLDRFLPIFSMTYLEQHIESFNFHLDHPVQVVVPGGHGEGGVQCRQEDFPAVTSLDFALIKISVPCLRG